MLDRENAAARGGQAGALAIGAAFGWMVDGAAGLLAGAALAPIIQTLALKTRERGIQNTNQLAEALTDLTGHSPEDLAAWCGSAPDRTRVFTTAFQAAYATVAREKIDALARVLHECVDDDARIEATQLIVDALSEIEAPHIRILRAMAQEVPSAQPDAEVIAPGAWSEFQLGARHPNLADAVVPMATRLARLGMLDEGTYRAKLGGKCFFITDFGLDCLSYLGERFNDDVPRMRSVGSRPASQGAATAALRE